MVCQDDHFSNRDWYNGNEDNISLAESNSNDDYNGNEDGQNIVRHIILAPDYQHNYNYYTRWEHSLVLYL